MDMSHTDAHGMEVLICMRHKVYCNMAGKSFVEGHGFKLSEFLDYYNTLISEEWDAVIDVAADRGYDIFNVKAYIRVYGIIPGFTPMSLEEVYESLLKYHGENGSIWTSPACIVDRETERRETAAFYASLGVPVPEYWKSKLWN